MKSLIITAQSAWSTLQICDRQARKDTAKVIRFSSTVAAILTSKQAVQTYRAVWNAFTICCMVAIACGSTVREFLDSYVEDCLKEEEAIGTTAPQIAPEPAPTVEECLATVVGAIAEDILKAGKAIAPTASLKSVQRGAATIKAIASPVLQGKRYVRS